MPFQFTFTKLRFFLLIMAMLIAAFLLFAIGRVTGGGSDSDTPVAGGASGAPGGQATGGQSAAANMNAKSNQVRKLTAVQSLLKIPMAPGQAQAMQGMTTATTLATMSSTPGAAPVAGTQPGAAHGAAPGTAPGVAPVSQQSAMQNNAVPMAAAQPQAGVQQQGGATQPGTAQQPGMAQPGQVPQAGQPTTMPAAAPAPEVFAMSNPPVRGAAFAKAPDGAGEPYVLQFGAFREQKEAKSLQEALLKFNVITVIIDKKDDTSVDDRLWHTVRYSGYRTMSEASREAAALTSKTSVLAVVRRSDSF